MSSEKALLAASNAKERLLKQKDMMVVQHDSLKPLPLETKSGPLMKPPDSSADAVGIALTQVPAKEERLPAAGSPGKFSSPRRRFSCSPTLPHPASMASSPKHRYRSNFDLKLTQVSRELETYISRQVLCSIMRKDVREESPK